MKTVCLLALLSLPIQIGAAFAQAPSDSPAPSDAEIRRILAKRIDIEKQSVGILVGIVSPVGRRIITYGNLAKDDKRPLNGDTVFEIGSMTKVFTSLVLMDMVQKGEVSLDDPVSKYLPASVHVPERAGKKITLKDLSTQTSGLPRIPTNFHPKDPRNPYADYTVDQLYEFLSGYTLTRDIGEKYEYSNVGVGLLGNALSRRAGTDYETMVEIRILKPLGMKDTDVTLSPDQIARLAVGHNAALKAVGNWDLPAFAGAGALRSTGNDMLTFLAANLGLIKTPLAAAMAAEVSVRRPTGTPNLEIAYAWHIFTPHGKPIYWHNGQTGGYHSFMGYNPETHMGAVVLSNVGSLTGIDDIGYHLLYPAFPLAKFTPPKEHKEIAIDSKILVGYTGQYQLAPNFIVTITQSGVHLYAQATGQPQFELFPEGQGRFFAKVSELTVAFQSDAEGNTTEFVLHQGGMEVHAKRLK